MPNQLHAGAAAVEGSWYLDLMGAAPGVNLAVHLPSPGSARAVGMAGCTGGGFADGAAAMRTRGGRQLHGASTAAAPTTGGQELLHSRNYASCRSCYWQATGHLVRHLLARLGPWSQPHEHIFSFLIEPRTFSDHARNKDARMEDLVEVRLCGLLQGTPAQHLVSPPRGFGGPAGFREAVQNGRS